MLLPKIVMNIDMTKYHSKCTLIWYKMITIYICHYIYYILLQAILKNTIIHKSKNKKIKKK